MRRVLLSFLSATVLTIGCGGTPTSPFAGGATINGNVVGGSTGMNVGVVGGGPSTTLGSNGTFSLTNVRAGDVSLEFKGAGVNSRVSLGPIERSEQVTVNISREGQNFVVDCIKRHGHDKVEIEGRIDGLPPLTPPGTFTIAGLNIQTNADTQIVKGDAPATFGDLAIGMRVHVRGTPNPLGVLAKIVKIQNTNVDLGVHLEGTISGFSGTILGFQFMLGGKLIKGDATTQFDDGLTFAALADGVKVEVKGQLKLGFIFATKIEPD